MRTKNSETENGILLLAKKPGKTSFASLSSVKHSLGTGKVGHTGTLDSFADGLLVVLTGKLTHLVPHITGFDKTYLALVEFGSETDTLDPTGKVIKEGRIPGEDEIRSVLPDFTGTIDQLPPLYSALHVNGKRASDLVRSGKSDSLVIPPRKITVHSIKLLDFYDKYALIEVRCSKGTYIRSLARDIANACGSAGHLLALRRTSVGPFLLEDAIGYDSLEDFTISAILKRKESLENPDRVPVKEENSGNLEEERAREHEEIKNGLLPMSFSLAELCGLTPVLLASYYVEAYSNGMPLNPGLFTAREKLPDSAELAVFYPKGKFAGIVVKKGRKFSYGFVVPPNRNFVVYTWDQIISGKFNQEYKERGSSLTIGSFDGPHIGHDQLFDSAISKRKEGLVPGVVTFTRSLRRYKNPEKWQGDISTLSQRLEVYAAKGFSFAVVIDFSTDFSKIEGQDFLKILIDCCGMKYLSEGKDFHCGYKGAVDMEMIAALGEKLGFGLNMVESVFYGEKKISSSRIRDCISKGDFKSASYMLDGHYCIDCTGFEWVRTEDGITAGIKGIQILPPEGSYNVMAILASGKSGNQKSGEAQSAVRVRAFRSDCTLENRHLHLAFSDELIGGFVRAIQFDK